MLGLNSNKNQNDSNAVNLISSGTKITGDITSAGDIRIDGTLLGNINTNGKFVLGVNGLIEGNIECTFADISGEVRGVITVTETLSLKQTAKITGDLIVSKLSIEPGALFNGTCNMGAKVKNMVQKPELLNASKTA